MPRASGMMANKMLRGQHGAAKGAPDGSVPAVSRTVPFPASDERPSMTKERYQDSNRSPIRPEPEPPSLSGLDMTLKVDRDRYETELGMLQTRLKEISLAYRDRRRAIIVFEGWDAAGKGGIIRRMCWSLDPRACKVWPIAAPPPEERGHHYLHRFWTRLPQRGELAIFDRSWYGRVLVERVERFAAEPEWRRAYAEINEFERMLSDDGIRLVKIFLHITPDEQLKRFRARFRDPLKRWKLSAEDLRNRTRFGDYEKATEEMFAKTSTVTCPWTVVPANDKKYARLMAFGRIVDSLSQDVDLAPQKPDPDFEERVRKLLGLRGDGG